MQAWAARPLDEVYAAVFIDAIVVKVRDGQVANRPVYAGDRGHPGRGEGRPGPVGRAPAGRVVGLPQVRFGRYLLLPEVMRVWCDLWYSW